MTHNADPLQTAWLHSRSFAFANGVREVLVAGARRSRAGVIWRGLTDQWTAGSWADQRRRLGVLLMVASATHALLLTTLGSVHSWMAFIIPVATAIVGGIALAASMPDQTRHR
jgi:hypothetical protein